MEGRGGKHRESDLICVLNTFQLVDGCLQAACNVFRVPFMPGRACAARGSVRVSAGGGVLAVAGGAAGLRAGWGK